jgi:hypothetical protein
VRAATQVRLALLDHSPIGEHRADMTGEVVGLRVGRVDLVAHL